MSFAIHRSQSTVFYTTSWLLKFGFSSAQQPGTEVLTKWSGYPRPFRIHRAASTGRLSRRPPAVSGCDPLTLNTSLSPRCAPRVPGQPRLIIYLGRHGAAWPVQRGLALLYGIVVSIGVSVLPLPWPIVRMYIMMTACLYPAHIPLLPSPFIPPYFFLRSQICASAEHTCGLTHQMNKCYHIWAARLWIIRWNGKHVCGYLSLLLNCVD